MEKHYLGNSKNLYPQIFIVFKICVDDHRTIAKPFYSADIISL